MVGPAESDPLPALGAVTDFRATPGNGQVSLTWTAPEGTTNHEIDIATSADFSANFQNNSLGSTPSSTVTNLTNGTTYYVRVTPISSGVRGTTSVVLRVTPQANASSDGQPSRLSAPNLTARVLSALDVTWRAPSSDGGNTVVEYDVRYREYRENNPPGWSTVDAAWKLELGNPPLSYRITGLTNGTEYEVQVRPVSSARSGDADWSPSRRATPGIPGPLDPPTFSNIGDTSVTINWLPPATDGGSPVTSYTVWRNEVGEGFSNTRTVTTGTSTTWQNLEAGTLYQFRVRASNTHGDGPRSHWARVRTGSEGKPDAPTGLTVSNLAPTGFRLDWDEPGDNESPITGYKYEILDVTADPDMVVTDFGAVVTEYRLNGGADQALFSITTAGVLTFNNPPDFEMPAYLNTDNDYVVIVAARSEHPADENDRVRWGIRTFTVTVRNVNEEPTAVDDTASGPRGGAVFIAAADLLANDTDPEMDELSVTAVGSPVNGMVSLNDGTITYTHDGSTTTTGSFRYTVSDGQFPVTGEVNITVTDDVDYDADDDGLIDISSLAQLNALRWDLDGDGTVSDDASTTNVNEPELYLAAFPDPATGMGCPFNACTGYELTADLDFDTGATGDRTDDAYYNGGSGWLPIGTGSDPFTATFDGNGDGNGCDGNGCTIANLHINRTSGSQIGLFGVTGTGSEVRRVNLTGVNVTAASSVGALAGVNHGTISGSSAAGSVTGSRDDVGGLVGRNTDTIIRSYATAAVSGRNRIGGLVGYSEGSIVASYASGNVLVPTGAGNNTGGLVGENKGSITASYATGFSRNQGGLVGRHDGARSGVTVTASFSTGRVSGGGGTLGDRGGLVGNNTAFNPFVTGGNVFNSYFDEDNSGYVTSNGGHCQTEAALREPTGYTGIYANWNLDLDGDSANDDLWDFGAAHNYPALRGGAASSRARGRCSPWTPPRCRGQRTRGFPGPRPRTAATAR